MMYCALEDAFQGPQGVPHPGCGDDEATRQARKEERRRARRSKVIPMGTPAETSKDPDRQPWNPLPDVPAMSGSKGHQEQGQNQETFDPYNKAMHTTQTHENPASPTRFAYHKDPIGQYARDECAQQYMTIPVNGTNVITSKRFFGAQGPTDEPYADYAPDSPDNSSLLQPDFTQAFQQRATQGAKATSAALPPPVLDQFWKPLTPSGVQTSFIEHLPPSHDASRSMGRGRSLRSAYEQGDISSEAIMKKLDQLFAKLEDMNHSTPEQLTSEMMMFVSSGIFVLFLMDLLVKRGSRF
jgi:hypothetical protein